MQCSRLPTVFLPHGGGPLPVLGAANHGGLTKFLKGVRKTLPEPKAILLVSAHWEESQVTVSTCPQPGMLYDYYGFPPAAYELKYPAPGSPAVAQRALQLLRERGIPAREDSARGFDHATFIPLMLAFPDASIPVVQMSLQRSLDPRAHLEVGKALSPLRDEGVMIIGSGLSFHNMQVFMSTGMTSDSQGPTYKPSEDFDAWLQGAVKAPGPEREALLAAWAKAPGARQSHPREEHLLPLMVAAGAAGLDPGRTTYSEPLLGARNSGFVFGA